MRSSSFRFGLGFGLVFALALAACSGGHQLVPAGGMQGSLLGRNARGHAACPYAGYSGSPSAPLKIVDLSGLKASGGWPGIYVLVGGTQYMTGNGTLQALPASGSIPAIPVASMCASFHVPTSTNRIYIAYGPGLMASDLNSPNLRTNKVLFDWVESSAVFTNNSGIGPNINADQFALPIEGMAKDSNGNYYAFGYKNMYGRVLADFKDKQFAAAHWNDLIDCAAKPSTIKAQPVGPCGAGKMALRVLQPYFAANGNTNYSSSFNNFPDVFYTPRFECPGGGQKCNYMQLVGDFYHTQNVNSPGKILFVPYITTVGSGSPCTAPPTPPGSGSTACPTYTVDYSKSTGVFTFTLQGSSSSTYPQTVTVGSGKTTDPLTSADIFGNVNLPPLGSSVSSQVAFYLQKYLQVDLNRGVAMIRPRNGNVVYHPVLPSCMPYETSPICYAKTYYHQGANQNVYSFILHAAGIQAFWKGQLYSTTWPWTLGSPGGAYGFPYDDTFSQSSFSTIPYVSGGSISSFILCVNPMVEGATKGCASITP